MSQNLSKNILATIAYYDVMDYPVTLFEIWKYLAGISDMGGKKVSLHDVAQELEDEKLRNFVETRQGFYFLKGRKELSKNRIERNKISILKIRKLRRIVWLLRFVPFFRMAGITGRLAMKNAEISSDWDLLVILEKGKIFTGRTLVTLLVHFLGKRRHGKRVVDRVCLNYFITTVALEINLKDMFSSSEYFFMLPLFGAEVFKNFQKNNSWIIKYKPNFEPEELAVLKMLEDSLISRLIRRIGEAAMSFSFIEEGLKKWQIARIEENPKTNKPSSGVVANDEMLVFLPEPHGPIIFSRFSQRLNEILGKTQTGA